ncbi:microtubule-destabilizing protein 60-like [Curcuma longa]|uniref:microtubule-destabilizing protein 60-like n=1 Tax=Curcuma longa TaxID=136217 RepID=UPI003D9E84BD
MATPSKKLQPSGSRVSGVLKVSENYDPNVPFSSPLSSQKSAKSTAIRSAQSNKSASRTAGRIVAPPPPPEPARKFIVAKKGSRRVGNGLDFERCRKEAYEALRASQDEFFRKGCPSIAAAVANPAIGKVEGSIDRTEKDGMEGMREILDTGIENPSYGTEDKNTRNLVMEDAMNIIPEPESGRVKHLVKAFESLLSISNDDEAEKCVYRNLNPFNCPLLGLQKSSKTVAAETSSAYVVSSEEFLPSRELPRDSKLCSLIDSSDQRLSLGRRTCNEGRKKRITSDSLRSSWNKMLKVTSQHPFKLRTEQRGRIKEEQFIKKVKEMLMEEEKQHIPIAQGLPWTTDEPEHLLKPPAKESTEPLDIVLHSDVRAVERAEFDNLVAERMSFAEQLRLKREMQQKLEEEEIRRLRRELVPKAQPMPYFDRPFVPKRSNKPQTIPRDPRFHIRPRKHSCSSASLFEC